MDSLHSSIKQLAMDKGENIPLERVQNYMRLQNLLNNIALPLLRKIFADNWTTRYQRDWINSESQGAEFVDDIGSNLYRDAGKIQKNLLNTGDIQKWDIPLMIEALKCFKSKSQSSQDQQKRCEKLKHVRNQLSHHGGLDIDDESFEKMWNVTADVLINLGVSQEDLKRAKIASVQENKENVEMAERLKAEGNSCVKSNNFKLAIQKYSEAIGQPGLPTTELAILHSNRSYAYLKLGNYYGAKDDAIGATLLNPNWWKGFGRLGNAYLSVEKFEQALANFEKAIQLDTDCKLQNERDHCVHMIAKMKRDEHLDPMNHATTFEQLAAKIKDKDGKMKLSGDQLHAMNGLVDMKHLPSGMCAEGHKYLYGNGVPQSYRMAAEWFSKAAAVGNAEGQYNLALLTKEGKGVRVDVAESIRLMKLAASQDIYYEILGLKMPNIGVVEAEHSLGLSYDEGVGVPRDLKKSLEWYTKAVKHGSGASANNIGIMYSTGVGVPRDKATALNYYKLGAALKLVRAMENVYDVYMTRCDISNALKWFKFAISRGSLSLQSRKESLRALVGSEIDEPIEEDLFELELMDEVKSGPLAHLFPKEPSTHDYVMNLLPSTEDKSTMVTSRSSLGLTDPYRIQIITCHRRGLRMIRNGKVRYEKGAANLLPKPMVDLFTLKPIWFADMDPTKDHIYEGFAIKLTLIEDAITGRPSIQQVAEDEKGDAQRIYIYNFPQNDDTQNKLGFGCKITVVNPYFRLAKDGRPMIRIDDISLMFLHTNSTNKRRCRYCGSENDSTVPCRHCKRSFYCSKVCLKKDSLELNHKDVCLKRL